MDKPIDIAENLGKKYLNKDVSRQLFIIMFILILFFGLISFLFYNTIKKIQVLSSETIALYNDTELILPSTNIYTNRTLRETYILYLSIDNASGSGLFYNSFNDNKTILRRKDDNFSINYNPKKNCLDIKFGIGLLELSTMNTGGEAIEEDLILQNRYESVVVCDIPYQKWFQLAIIINNRTIDVYINKYLRKTQILQNVPQLSNDTLILGKKNFNPNLFVGRVEYVPDTINNNELSALYFKNMNFLKIDKVLRNKINYDAHIKIHKDDGKNELVPY